MGLPTRATRLSLLLWWFLPLGRPAPLFVPLIPPPPPSPIVFLFASDKDRLRKLLDDRRVSPAEAQLLLAARMGDAPTVAALVGAGVDPNVPDAEGSTPLMRAASRGHVDAVAAVLAAPSAVDVAAVNAWGYDATIYLGSVRSSQPAAFATIEALLGGAGGDVSRVALRWSQPPVWRGGERP